MGAADDLNHAVTALATGYQQLHDAVQTEITALQSALQSDDSAAIQASIANITAITSTMANDAAAALTRHRCRPPLQCPRQRLPLIKPRSTCRKLNMPPITEQGATPPGGPQAPGGQGFPSDKPVTTGALGSGTAGQQGEIPGQQPPTT